MAILEQLKKLSELIQPKSQPAHLLKEDMQPFLTKESKMKAQPYQANPTSQPTADGGKAIPSADMTGAISSYSHGLEAIYRLETVDPRSIRKFGEGAKQETPPLQKVHSDDEPCQLELDFGESFYTWIPSFRLDEPIQVLELSQQAQQALLSMNKRSIRDLKNLSDKDFLYMKGLGQGHIDEIKRKLQNYTKGPSLERSYSIDFGGFLRCLVSDMQKITAYLLLEPFGLSSIIQLSPQQNSELKRLSPEKRRDLALQGNNILTSPEKNLYVAKKFEGIAKAFIAPWLEKRHFLATEDELNERLLALSLNHTIGEKALLFFSQLYFNGQFPLSQILPHEKELYFVSETARNFYQELIKKVATYFYNSQLEYPFAWFLLALKKELACKWEGFSDSFLEKGLRLSPVLRVRKGNLGELSIKLA
ncbi:MAG: hypothetical protein K0S07_1502 [Chlamydiales bacterium]|jgi:hypothetical protein|nr:hypothetical protein [Chlamydiales bacterium]